MRRRNALAIALALLPAACGGNPQQLPVGVGRCDAVQSGHGFTVIARVQNNSTKPISSLDLATQFYRQFAYSSYAASAALKKELDPGQKRDITFVIASPKAIQGEAMRCVVTRIGYLDGTSQQIPSNR